MYLRNGHVAYIAKAEPQISPRHNGYRKIENQILKYFKWENTECTTYHELTLSRSCDRLDLRSLFSPNIIPESSVSFMFGFNEFTAKETNRTEVKKGKLNHSLTPL